MIFETKNVREKSLLVMLFQFLTFDILQLSSKLLFYQIKDSIH